MVQKSTTLLRMSACAAGLFLGLPSAHAAELAGVQMPDHKVVEGVPLTLNGMALRTYSVLNIHIFVAGLFLSQPSHDAAAIMASPEPKLLRFVFVHDVDIEKSRNSWKKSLATNCEAPCHLPSDEVAKFLASVPAMSKGDTVDLLFNQQGVDFTVNGRSLGQVTDPLLTHVILRGYIGPDATPPSVRDGILGLN
ncbi:chalcone isomerase family protein [Acidisoma cellulosilytica]|uniref:Chalcone isomerase family protein n=1 Tax=Acidisoma cellulosilyticum TaxID=2802395 RepID=A0A963Z3G8_9PROT|nr:chalcone isomerase family protein [Acidisoma cellulosilyticum]MCB8881799.1 chalcone isomerase family protein [Acidisoma cellulosilyticum]